MTLAHFGFGKDGEVLDDAELPANLTADWQEDEANAGKPFPSYARLLAQARHAARRKPLFLDRGFCRPPRQGPRGDAATAG